MTRTEVLVVEARQYEHEGARIIVPVLIGYTDEIRKIKETVTVSPASDRGSWTKERLVENARQSNPEMADIVESLVAGLDGLGLSAQGLPSCVNYGIEHGQDFLALLALYPRSIYLNVAKVGYSKLSPEAFTKWKSEVNHIARFYNEDSLSEPSNKGALGPHYDVLSGKVKTFVNVISALKVEIEKAFATSV
ncbi:MAG TPA: hypothetical protein VIH58_09115 [Chthoniobacterales bacterium]